MKNAARTEDFAGYEVERLEVAMDDDGVIEKALEILEKRLQKPGEAMLSPKTVKAFLAIELSVAQTAGREVFCAMWLDAQNRVMAFEELFCGTLTQVSVYPREVVREALEHQAAGVILAHNHPSGVAEPSHADELITQSLKQALALIDVKVLDHIIIGAGETMSFAERGLL